MGSPRVRDFERIQLELRRQLAAEVDLALRVAVLIQLGLPQREIASRLGCSIADVKAAIARLRNVARALERGEQDWAE